jgi:hypothetical protein
MKIRHTQGNKCKGDRIYSIETKGKEIFSHAHIMVLINALAKNESLIYKDMGLEETNRPFFFEEAVKEAIRLGKNGHSFIDDKDTKAQQEFCKKYYLPKNYYEKFKQTLINDFGKEE